MFGFLKNSKFVIGNIEAMKVITNLMFGTLMLLLACKPHPIPQYAIQGHILNGTTGQPIYLQQQLVATAHTYSIPQKSAQIGSCNLDDKGNFKLTYSQTDINYDRPTIDLLGSTALIKGLAVNANIDSTFYFSYVGKLKFYLQTATPLSSSDTLFLLYGNGTTQVTDTIYSAVNGYYKTVSLQTPRTNIFWGRGIVNLKKSEDVVSGYGHSITGVHIDGDPYIDSVTINY